MPSVDMTNFHLYNNLLNNIIFHSAYKKTGDITEFIVKNR